MRKFLLIMAVLVLAAVSVLPAAAQDRTIVDALVANESSFSTLIAAADAAGLVDTLAEGEFTVFAPTNGAFAAALAELGITAEDLLADTETLTSILTYHVVPGTVTSTDLLGLIDEAEDGVAVIETVNGATITAELVTIPVAAPEVAEGEPTPEPEFATAIYLNRGTGRAITVTVPDISASNGVVHAISGVLLPPAGDEGGEEAAAEETNTIVDIAAGDENFSTLVAAVDAAGLVETLSGGNFTVFAPTNDAFAAALEALGLTAEDLLADTETLTTVLTYHVVRGDFSAEDLISLADNGVTELNTVAGEPLPFSVEDGAVIVGGATVTAADIEADNGVIHVIDGVLLPPSMTAMDSGEDMDMEAEAEGESMEMMGDTIVDVAAGNEDFSTLVAAVQAAGLVETLSGEGPFTVFAPTNDAFAAALEALGLTAEDLLADTDTLTTILTYHVVAGEVTAEDVALLVDASGGTAEVETVSGELLTIEIMDGVPVLAEQGVSVVTADVTASNGVIHVIDGVLLPPSMMQ